MYDYNFSVKGTGRNILLVHGWGGSLESLRALQDELSKSFRVYSLELPGHGTSTPPEKGWGVSDFTNFITDFLNKEKINNVTYVGHSFGGKLGIAVTSRNSEAFERLVLVNASGIKPKNSIKKIFWGIISFIVKPILNLGIFSKLRTFVYRFIIRETDYLNTSGTVKETFKKIIDAHFDHEISKIKTPTLIIWGERDTYTPLWMGQKLHSQIENSTFLVFPSKHNLPLEKPVEVAETIKIWIG